MDLLKIINELSSDLKEIDLPLIKRDIRVVVRAIKNLNNPNNEKYKKNIEQLAERCSDKSYIDPQWALLGGRISVYRIKQLVPKTFSESTKLLSPIFNKEYSDFIESNAERLNSFIIDKNDYNFDLFAIRTLAKSYLAHLKINGTSQIMETPQYMYLRVATFLWFPNIEKIKKTYELLSAGNYSHATPTLFNAGFIRAQMSSCFLRTVRDDMQDITLSWSDIAFISKNSGGLGINVSKLRHSEIGQNGFSNGVIKWIKVYESILKCVDQGGKRSGSGTMFLRDCHIDINEYIEMKDPDGPKDTRAPDLFYAICVSDLFMKRIENNENWSLFCPNKAKGLFEKYGSEFETLYVKYEKKGIYSRQIKARDLWDHILKSQAKVAMPFIIYIDAANRKSNQKHSGFISQSNLCQEILEVTSDKEIANCNLASIALNKCIEFDAFNKPFFNFDKLESYTREVVQNLNQVINRNYYIEDVPGIKYSNLLHRPLGIGVQGQADAFAILDISWVIPNPDPKYPVWEDQFIISPQARKLNKDIYETQYMAGVRESAKLAKEFGSYETFKGSPASRGFFQFDLWVLEKLGIDLRDVGEHKDEELLNMCRSSHFYKNSRYTIEQWELARKEMKEGMYNSLLFALMPTASSAHLLDNNEAFETFTENIFARTILAGQYLRVNKYTVKDLKQINLWNTETVRNIFNNKGSIQFISECNLSDETLKRLQFIKLKYRTAFEIPQKVILQMAIERGPYICQTQSMNYWMKDPTVEKLNAAHFYGWKNGLKTGMYYCRQKTQSDPINFAMNSINIPINFPINNLDNLDDQENYIGIYEKISERDLKLNKLNMEIKNEENLDTVINFKNKDVVCTEEKCTMCFT